MNFSGQGEDYKYIYIYICTQINIHIYMYGEDYKCLFSFAPINKQSRKQTRTLRVSRKVIRTLLTEGGSHLLEKIIEPSLWNPSVSYSSDFRWVLGGPFITPLWCRELDGCLSDYRSLIVFEISFKGPIEGALKLLCTILLFQCMWGLIFFPWCRPTIPYCRTKRKQAALECTWKKLRPEKEVAT